MSKNPSSLPIFTEKRFLELNEILNEAYEKYHITKFIDDDPVKFIHAFESRADREIAGLFAALFAWGNRKIILNKLDLLFSLMDYRPKEFISSISLRELNQFQGFTHRTFREEDIVSILSFLKKWYSENESLEGAFQPLVASELSSETTLKERLIGFKTRFHEVVPMEHRVKKHISSPESNSACKRLNLFLRWMVRADDKGIDLGIWKTIPIHSLHLPLDVHSLTTAQTLGLLDVKAKSNWKTTELITQTLQLFDKEDPIRFDYSLFCLGEDGFNKRTV